MGDRTAPQRTETDPRNIHPVRTSGARMTFLGVAIDSLSSDLSGHLEGLASLLNLRVPSTFRTTPKG